MPVKPPASPNLPGRNCRHPAKKAAAFLKKSGAKKRLLGWSGDIQLLCVEDSGPELAYTVW